MSGKVREPMSPSKLYEFDSYIFTHSIEASGKTIAELEDEIEKNKLTIFVRTSSGKTISIQCDKKQKVAIISDEVERRSLIPPRKSDEGKENNRGKQHWSRSHARNVSETAGRNGKNEQMDRKMMKPSDTVNMRRDIMEAIKRSDEKMENYSRRTDDKMQSYSRKADDMMEKFLPSSVGIQLQGMNSSIVKKRKKKMTCTSSSMKESRTLINP